jgi:hypothetical protein
LAILWQGFRKLGLARKAAATKDRRLELLLWGFGATLFSNAVAFVGIWYFDQSSLVWYALLAMIATITSAMPKRERTTEAGSSTPLPDAISPDGTRWADAAPRHIFT